MCLKTKKRKEALLKKGPCGGKKNPIDILYGFGGIINLTN
jgi:hypothetical protein